MHRNQPLFRAAGRIIATKTAVLAGFPGVARVQRGRETTLNARFCQGCAGGRAGLAIPAVAAWL